MITYTFTEHQWVDGTEGEAGDSGLTFTYYELEKKVVEGKSVGFKQNGSANDLEGVYVQALCDYFEITYLAEELVWDLLYYTNRDKLGTLKELAKEYGIEVIVIRPH